MSSFLIDMLLILYYETLIWLKIKPMLVSLCQIHTALWRYIYTINSSDCSDGYNCMSWSLSSFGWSGYCFENLHLFFCVNVFWPHPIKEHQHRHGLLYLQCNILNMWVVWATQNNSSLFVSSHSSVGSICVSRSQPTIDPRQKEMFYWNSMSVHSPGSCLCGFFHSCGSLTAASVRYSTPLRGKSHKQQTGVCNRSSTVYG